MKKFQQVIALIRERSLGAMVSFKSFLSKSLLGEIPGTPFYVLGAQIRIRRWAKEWLAEFDKLSSIDAVVKSGIRKSFRNKIIYVFCIREWQLAVNIWAIGIVPITVLVVILIMALSEIYLLSSNSPLWTSLTSWMHSVPTPVLRQIWLAFMVGALTPYLVLLINRVLPHRNYFARGAIRKIFSLGNIVISFAIMVYVVTTSPLGLPRTPILALLLAFSLPLFGVQATLSLGEGYSELLSTLTWKRAYIVYPNIMINYFLFRTLRSTEINQRRSDYLAFKNKHSEEIEQIAELFEVYLPRSVKSKDPLTDRWFTSQCNEIAAAFRLSKQLILSPKDDTCKDFTQFLSRMFVSFAAGNWDALERNIAEPKEKLSRVWLSKSWEIIKIVFVAVLPWPILYVLQIANMQFSDPIFTYVKIFSFLWTIVSLIIAIDPAFSAKIAAIKDMTSIIQKP